VAEIVAYAERAACRHARICGHFGQQLDPPCGACDVCASAGDDASSRPPADGASRPRAAAAPLPVEPTAPRLPPAAAILGCLAEAPFALTKTGLTRVLLGEMAAPLRLDRTRYHGALRGLGSTAIEKTVDRLLAEGYLARQQTQARDGRVLSVLVPTEQGRAGPPPWDAAPTTRSPGRSSPGAPAPATADYDPDSFERLRAWRRQEAAEAGIAPFMVLSDATLRALAAVPPDTLDRHALALVPGIGPAKLARYGAALLALLHKTE
jgi:superfamily II DNA helicase RecQ